MFFRTDTGESGGFLGNNSTEPATMYDSSSFAIAVTPRTLIYPNLTSYAYDVDPTTQAFKNRRVFAYVDNGVPDGIQVDTEGRVYSGCGDGVQVSF